MANKKIKINKIKKNQKKKKHNHPRTTTHISTHVNLQEGLTAEFRLGRLHLRASRLCGREGKTSKRNQLKHQSPRLPKQNSNLRLGGELAVV